MAVRICSSFTCHWASFCILQVPTSPNSAEDSAGHLIISLCSCMSGCKPKRGQWEIQALLGAALQHQTRADSNR